MQETHIVRPYHWEWENDAAEIGRTQIRAWALNSNSEPCLLRFDDYAIPCHVLLSQTSGYHSVVWTTELARSFYDTIRTKMSEYRMSAFKPNHFKWMKPLYSLDAIEDFEDLESDELLEMIRRGEAGAEPVLVFYFASAKGIDVLKRILKYPQRLDTGGRYCKVEAQVVMSEISPKDKLLTNLGLRNATSRWKRGWPFVTANGSSSKGRKS